MEAQCSVDVSTHVEEKNGSGSSQKLTFRHGAPASVEPGYWMNLERKVNATETYWREHLDVCNDIVHSCEIMENSENDEPSLFTPTKDQLASPLQSLRQFQLLPLGKPSVWQQFASYRNKLMDDLGKAAQGCAAKEFIQVEKSSAKKSFAESMSFSFVRRKKSEGSLGSSVADTPTLAHGASGVFRGMLSPSNSMTFGSPSQNASGNFSPSPNRVVSSQSPSPLRRRVSDLGKPLSPSMGPRKRELCKISKGSYLDIEKTILIHFWENGQAARCFTKSWQKVWQILFEHRIDMIFCPVSSMFCLRGMFVSVTALPPIHVSKPMPIENVGGPDSQCSDSMLHHMALRLSAALFLHTQSGFRLYAGFDGRYYLCDLDAVLSEPIGCGAIVFVPRYKLLLKQASHAIDEAEPPKSLDAIICTECIPAVVDHILRDFTGDSQGINFDSFIRDSALVALIHRHGVNVSFLCCVADQLAKRAASTPQEQSIIKVAIAAIKIEIVGRVLKNFVRLEIAAAAGDSGIIDVPDSRKFDSINRLARWVVGRKQGFLQDHVLPYIRKHFHHAEDLPQTWLDWSMFPPSSTLKVLAAKLGCVFNSDERRFDKFVHSVTPIVYLCNAPLEALLAQNNDDASAAVSKMWTEASQMPPDTVRRETFIIRAISFSIMTGTHSELFPKDIKGPELSLFYKITLLRMYSELSMTCEGDQTQLRQLLSYIDGATPRLVSMKTLPKLQEEIPAEQVDVAFCSHIKLQCASLLERAKHPVDLQLLCSALQDFIALPFVDFVFNTEHTEALHVVESLFPLLSTSQVNEFLSSTVELVVNVVVQKKRPASASRYLARVIASLIGNPNCETCPAVAKIAQLSYTLHTSAFGRADGRTLLSLYCLVYVALTCTKDPSVASIVSNCKAIVDKAKTLTESQHAPFYRTRSVYATLQRALRKLSEIGDMLTAASLKPHVAMLKKLNDAVVLMQSCGRGMLGRLQCAIYRAAKTIGEKAGATSCPSAGVRSTSKPADVSWTLGQSTDLQSPQQPTSQRSEPKPTTSIVDVDDHEEEDRFKLSRRRSMPGMSRAAAPPTLKGLLGNTSDNGNSAQRPHEQPASGEDSISEEVQRQVQEKQEDMEDIADLFLMCDTDNDGMVSVEDCVAVFSKFHNAAHIRDVFSQGASRASGQVRKMTMSEFSSVVTKAGLM